MTDTLNSLIAAAKEDFSKARVNKAVDSLIKAVELLAGGTTVPETAMAVTINSEGLITDFSVTPVEEAPAEEKAVTPADLAKELAEEKVKRPKRVSTRSSDVN